MTNFVVPTTGSKCSESANGNNVKTSHFGPFEQSNKV